MADDAKPSILRDIFGGLKSALGFAVKAALVIGVLAIAAHFVLPALMGASALTAAGGWPLIGGFIHAVTATTVGTGIASALPALGAGLGAAVHSIPLLALLGFSAVKGAVQTHKSQQAGIAAAEGGIAMGSYSQAVARGQAKGIEFDNPAASNANFRAMIAAREQQAQLQQAGGKQIG